MKRFYIDIVLSLIVAGGVVSTASWAENLESHFECKDYGNGTYRPYYLQAGYNGASYRDYSKEPKGQLGQHPMQSQEECSRALENANHQYGVICSRTGLNGWKPTLYTGTLPGRADFGYMGGSSIMKFDDCLKTTANSSAAGICYWGGSAWYVGRIDRSEGVSGPYKSVDECITHTAGGR